jgi:hypothetical protein
LASSSTLALYAKDLISWSYLLANDSYLQTQHASSDLRSSSSHVGELDASIFWFFAPLAFLCFLLFFSFLAIKQVGVPLSAPVWPVCVTGLTGPCRGTTSSLLWSSLCLRVDAWWSVDVVEVVEHISTGSSSSSLSTSSHLVWTISNINFQMRWAPFLIALLYRIRSFSSLHTQLHKRLVITTLSRSFSNPLERHKSHPPEGYSQP